MQHLYKSFQQTDQKIFLLFYNKSCVMYQLAANAITQPSAISFYKFRSFLTLT